MLRRIFPNEYDLDEIKKYKAARAHQFVDSRDAFQQLVGDALRFTFGNSAFISQTAGQDGSIDSYIEYYSKNLTSPFEQLEQPIIIECKSHQPSKRLDENIEQEWYKLRKKLTEQAENGWKNLFAPWENAKSYVYCISSNSSSKEFHNKLTSKIENFFSNLPLENRPPIEKVQVLDWGGLRHWFNDISKLCDLWLGIDSSLIIGHQNFKNSLEGFKQFLLSEKFAFVEPEPNALFHPQKIFERLKSTEDKNNVLIVGAGGVGKTRTSTEVAELAEQEGWRVLHILAGELEIENKDLTEAVLHYSGKTLMIFDYVDQMDKLDLGTIHRILIPTAKEKGNELAVLGNSRPGWMNLENPERDELFFKVELKPSDSQRQKITRKVIDEIAPRACEKLGRDFVKGLCGERSIIALLIALELERQVTKYGSTKDELKEIRQGDLTAWLRKRLSEDEFVATKDKYGSAHPEPWLIISASVLACVPERKEFLLEVADKVNQAINTSKISEYIVDTLIKLGWIEKTSNFYSTPHDVVADEVFDQAIHFEKYVHKESLHQILTPTLTYARSLAGFATTFERVLGAIQDKEIYTRIKQEAETWLSKNAKELGRTLAYANSYKSAFSIGAVFNGNVWRDIALNKWVELVDPWLIQHGKKKAARHLLYKGLKKISSVEKINLLNIALDWLDRHANEPEADSVIAPLLRRKELTEEQSEKAIEYTLKWLKTNYLNLEAGFVLPPLLSKIKNFDNRASDLIQKSVQWLNEYFDTRDAEFVINKLFKRKDIDPQTLENLIHATLERLRTRLNDEEATYLIKWCLKPRINNVGLELERLKVAINWLKVNKLQPNAEFVWNEVLRKRLTKNEDWIYTSNVALEWLKTANVFRVDIDHTTNSLLERPFLLSEENLQYVVKQGIEWIKANKRSKTEPELYRAYKGIRIAVENSPTTFLLENLFLELDEIVKESAFKETFEKEKIDIEQQFNRVKKSVEILALKPTIVLNDEEIKEICEVINKQSNYSVQSVSYIVVPLLVLGLRSAGKDNFEIIKKTIESLMLSQELSDIYKKNIRLIFSTLLQQDLFDLSIEQKVWLEKIGIISPLPKKKDNC